LKFRCSNRGVVDYLDFFTGLAEAYEDVHVRIGAKHCRQVACDGDRGSEADADAAGEGEVKEVGMA
jgi:hypothetical protein